MVDAESLGGASLQQPLVVKPDPRDEWTQAQYEAGYAYARKYATVYGKIDQALNNLDAIKKSLGQAATATKDPSLQSQIAAAQQQWVAVFGAFTADYKNDEDSIQRPGSLRESMPRTGFGTVQLPPTVAQLDYAKRFDAAYGTAMSGYNSYVGSLEKLQTALKVAGVKPLQGLNPVTP